MKVIPPITLNHTNVTSNASSDGDPAEWDTSSAYAVGTTVKVTASNINKVYQCIIGTSNTDSSPEVDILKSIPKWVELGSINKYAMFDTWRNTQTTASGISLTITIVPGMSVSSLAILGMTNVTEVLVEASRAGYSYSKSFNTSERFTNSWYTYFFGHFRTKAAVILFDLATQYTDLTIVITFNGNGIYGVGACILGSYIDIGSTQNGATSELLNFSSIDRDIYGTAYLIQRRSIPKTKQRIYIDRSKLETLLSVKNDLDMVPAVWSGIGDDIDDPYFDALLILGFYRTFSFDISNPIGVMIDLELEEI